MQVDQPFPLSSAWSAARTLSTSACTTPGSGATVWVLDTAYDCDRASIVAALRRLLGARGIAVRSFDRIGAALDAYERGRGDFAHYLIREDARAEGCDAVVTFDRALQRDEGFRAP